MNINDEYETVGRYAREIVAKRAAVTTGVATALNVLIVLHVIPVEWTTKTEALVAIGLNVLAALVGVLWARDAVTPADPKLNPTTVAGDPLTAAATPIPAAELVAKYTDPQTVTAQVAAALTATPAA